MDERILHALDLAIVGDWDGVKAALHETNSDIADRLWTLATRQQEVQQGRARGQALARHELGNAISVAQANVEGLADGVLEVTRDRLNGIKNALITASVLLDNLKQEAKVEHNNEVVTSSRFDICDVISAQVAMVGGLAGSKSVRVLYDGCGAPHPPCTEFTGNAARTGQLLRNVLINAIRYTPPEGRIDIHACRPDGELTFTVSDANLPQASQLLQALDGAARLQSETPKGMTLAITVPAMGSSTISPT